MKRLALAVMLASPAAAQDTCGDRDGVIAGLGDMYAESLQFAGIAPLFGTSDVMFMEAYANRETGSWTIIVTRPDGKTCLLAVGTDFLFVLTPHGEPT